MKTTSQQNMSGNKALVQAGHQLAKAMDNDTPLIEIAKLVSSLATALDVQTVLAQQLAAESATLKSKLMYWDAEDPEQPYDSPLDLAQYSEMVYGDEFDVQVAARLPNLTYRVVGVTPSRLEIELVKGELPETPATDAYLSSMRTEAMADGADLIASKSRVIHRERHEAGDTDSAAEYLTAAVMAENVAKQLREGKAGEVCSE